MIRLSDTKKDKVCFVMGGWLPTTPMNLLKFNHIRINGVALVYTFS